MPHIILDGYNVIRSDPRLASFERQSMEQARTVLIQTLASAPRLAGYRILVVFDGMGGSRSHVHGQRRGGVDTMYSAAGQTADAVIVAQAETLTPHNRVVVVSNDVAVRESCRALGCEISGVENLLGQVPGRIRSAGPPDEEAPMGTLSTIKRGNHRRTSRKARRDREVRF